MAEANIERLIIIGLITSTEYIKEIREIYSINLIESASAKKIAEWCIEYYDTYNKAPQENIEGIYFEKIKTLPADIISDISEILSDLSDEFDKSLTDIQLLVDLSKKRFTERHLYQFQEKIQNLLLKNKIKEAQYEAENYKPLNTSKKDNELNLGDKTVLSSIDKAFSEASKPLITFPKQLGQFWNDQFVPGGFIAFLAPEKRGKTWLLLDIVNRAVEQNVPVAFFQAGDMSEGQQLRRFCIHLAKSSDKEKYCEKHFQPIRDCVHNQRDTCNKPDRECDFGVFETLTESQIRNEITMEQLKKAFQENPEYKPCWNCKEYENMRFGCVWLKEIPKTDPLNVRKAKKLFFNKYIRNQKKIMLSTFANGTLSVRMIKNKLNEWEKLFGFIPKIIVVDYADLLVPSTHQEFRHQQNEIWKELRNLSQEPRGGNLPLVITPTQADADSYESGLLKLKNFSEDKRKFAHVTAFYGLNQDPKGREKQIGIMRINSLLLREDEFDVTSVCYILQNLKRGQPILASYF